jgi:AraC-like DNA-binding protein
MPGLIRSASLTNYAEVARQVGLDPARMLSEVGLPQRCLRDLELKVFIREQATLRQAIEALIRYGRQLNGAVFLTLEEGGDVVVLREELIVGHQGPVRQSTELAIGVAFGTLTTFLGADWKPRRVCFAHDAPRNRSVHERVFGRNVEFGHDFNGIVFARRDLEARNPDADPAMARYARQLIDASLGRDSPDTSAQVREIVLSLLGTGRCTIDLVAQHLGVDRRTVHRHLATEGHTFSAIVDAVRRELADRYLRDRDRTMAEVSSMLGFSAPSGFSRWYRKQFDRQPSERHVAIARPGRPIRSRARRAA